ncbi:MAG: signal peptide peptidase SppA [Bradymonadaceae bacterium]|nr:signal peptide peptidase SppA [Lujinxingiaceae bacterium]
MKKRGILTIVLIFAGLFIALMIFVAVLISAFSPDGLGFGKPSIGVVEIAGPIMDSKKALEDIKAFSENELIHGVVIRVDSPGGAVAPSQEIFEAVKKLKVKKPVAVSMGSTAASGGYYIAIGSDVIFANPGSITGSIGVITQLFNVESIMDKIDVKVHTVTTGPFKDSGSPFKEFSVDDENYFHELIDDIYLQFIEDVAQARSLELGEVRKLADGRVFTGRQAKVNKLVDEIGTIDDAIAHVAARAGIEGDPKVVYPPKERMGFLSEMLRASVNTTFNQVQSRTSPRLQYLYVGPQ